MPIASLVQKVFRLWQSTHFQCNIYTLTLSGIENDELQFYFTDLNIATLMFHGLYFRQLRSLFFRPSRFEEFGTCFDSDTDEAMIQLYISLNQNHHTIFMHPDSESSTLWSVGSSPTKSYVLPRWGQEARRRHAKVRTHDPPPGSIPRLHFQHQHRKSAWKKPQIVFVFLFALGPFPVMSFNLYSIRNEIAWKYVFLKHEDGVKHILVRCRLDISFQL